MRIQTNYAGYAPIAKFNQRNNYASSVLNTHKFSYAARPTFGSGVTNAVKAVDGFAGTPVGIHMRKVLDEMRKTIVTYDSKKGCWSNGEKYLQSGSPEDKLRKFVNAAEEFYEYAQKDTILGDFLNKFKFNFEGPNEKHEVAGRLSFANGKHRDAVFGYPYGNDCAISFPELKTSFYLRLDGKNDEYGGFRMGKLSANDKEYYLLQSRGIDKALLFENRETALRHIPLHNEMYGTQPLSDTDRLKAADLFNEVVVTPVAKTVPQYLKDDSFRILVVDDKVGYRENHINHLRMLFGQAPKIYGADNYSNAMDIINVLAGEAKVSKWNGFLESLAKRIEMTIKPSGADTVDIVYNGDTVRLQLAGNKIKGAALNPSVEAHTAKNDKPVLDLIILDCNGVAGDAILEVVKTSKSTRIKDISIAPSSSENHLSNIAHKRFGIPLVNLQKHGMDAESFVKELTEYRDDILRALGIIK